MKESIGYTVTLNIVITFIIIVFAFLSAALIYFKSNKVSNVVTETIEKYEGYNAYAKNEISGSLNSLGYNKKPVNCQKYYNKIGETERQKNCLLNLNVANGNYGLTDGKDGYCVFVCREYSDTDEDYYYYYKTSTNMMINIPIINDILDIPIFSNTNRLYDFACQESDPSKC